MPLVEMTEEQIARRYANSEGLALIDWSTLSFLVDNAPSGSLVFDTAKCTYRCAEPQETKV